MLVLHLGRLELRFRFWFFAVILLFIEIGREVLAVYLVLPIVIHESGHLLCMLLLREELESITFTPVSVDIVRAGPARLVLWRELCISLSGIAANLLAALLLYLYAFQSMRVMFLVAANLAVALFNLLPIGDLDGGQVMGLVCGHFFSPQSARSLSLLVSFLVLTPLFALSLWLLFSGNGNFTLLLTCLYLVFTIVRRER